MRRRAREFGLVNRVVPADALLATVAELSGRLAEGPTRTLALTKGLVNRAHDLDRTSAFADEAMAQDLNLQSADAIEGLRSFAERRDPVFRGW